MAMMTSPTALERAYAQRSPSELAHLRRLQATWGMLADFCFSDLVLYIPSSSDEFVVVNHIRPTTAPTIYHTALTGETRRSDQRPRVARSFELAEMVSGEIDSAWLEERVQVTCIPVVWEGSVIAVLARESAASFRGRIGQLELIYLQVFDRFAAMICQGQFPFADEPFRLSDAPRVGDGVVVLDADRRVEFASPNATSALTRLGAKRKLVGRRLPEIGIATEVVADAYRLARPRVDEVEADGDVVIGCNVLPLIEDDEVTAAVLLLRDISELRRRDRLLMSKDATIREIHHRVKNNLQTVSSLLRLQGRRLSEPTAVAAIDESVRRIRAIALVHETLSFSVGDDVPFNSVLRPLLRMVEDGLVSTERPVRVVVVGDAGVLPSPFATALSVVLTELVQNAVQHGFPAEVDLDSMAAEVTISLETVEESIEGRIIRVVVADNGVGLPDEVGGGGVRPLGLSIVQTLVESELAGTLSMRRGDGEGGRPGAITEIVATVVDRPGDNAVDGAVDDD